jgi:hypothetical protein
VSAPPGEVDFRGLIEPVARHFLGEPNPHLSTRDELRWGSHGSLSVKLGTDQFYDHEAGVGGGVVKFIEHTQAWEHEATMDWLRDAHPDRFGPRPKANGDARHHAPVASKGVIEKTYDYVDEQGALLYQVVRKRDPKSFLQRRPDPQAEGGWNWSTRGVRPVIYRLPQVLAAIKAGKTVYIVEGEKDVDRCWRAGLVATCNAGGAGKWRPELNEFFRGASVAIIGDHDPQARSKAGDLLFHKDHSPQLPGQDHARDVARQIAPVAKRVRLLPDLGDAWPACPSKGDVSDFLDSGRTTADLAALVEALPDYRIVVELPPAVFTAHTLEGLPLPSRAWHVPDLVPGRTVTLLGGDGGVGKSIVALQLAIATAAGLPWMGQAVRQGPALHLSAEDDRDELHIRSDQISIFYGIPLSRLDKLTLWPLADEDAVLVTGRPGETLQPTARWEELKRLVAHLRPSLIILDSLADVYAANENDRSQVRQFVHLLRGLAMPINAAIVLLAHPSLTGMNTGSGLSGSTAWNNSVRSRLYLSAPDAEDGAPSPDLRTLTVKKANYTQAGTELKLRYVAGAFDCDAPGGLPVMSGLDRQIAADRVDAQFLELLDAFTREGRLVGHNRGHIYAPALFAADPRARGTTNQAFAAAMNRAFAAAAIHVVSKGPPSRRISFIARTEGSVGA